MKFFFLVCCAAAMSYVNAQKLTVHPFEEVNSPKDEQHPIVSPDGKILYFTLANHAENIGGQRDKGDIWFSRWVGGRWSAPIHAGRQLNNTGYNMVGGISQDGLRLYVFGHYNLSGGSKNQGVAISHKTSAGWSIPQIVTIPYFPSRSSTLSGYVSPNEDILIFAGESYLTSGGEDIYVCIKDAAGQWGEPKNVGEHINTPYQEVSPWLTEDTKYLYFASNGYAGHGSFDIYRARRLDNSWTNWSTPINMGEAINSAGRELSYSVHPKTGMAIYTTTKNSDGYGDFRAFNFSEQVSFAQEGAKDTVELAKVVAKSNTTDDALIRIRGEVREEGTAKPIASVIHFYADSVLKTASGADGSFSIAFPSAHAYPHHVKIEASGYISYFQPLDTQKLASNVLEMSFELYPIAIGATVSLQSVLFQRSTDNLLEDSFDELDMVVDFMTKNPSVEIELEGHTDNRGIHVHNVRLSQQRVSKVKKYLVDRGINKERISGKGYGGIRPIASNDAEATRKLNRRVEFTIIKR